MSDRNSITKEQILGKLSYVEDGGFVWKEVNSNRIKVGQKAGWDNGGGYRSIYICNKIYKEHRLVFFIHNGWWPEEVDHIDGNRSNNKIENLRAATKTQNQHNRGKDKTNTTGFKGVSKRKDKFIARINIDKKSKHIGLFDTAKEAYDAYCKKAIELRGEFAKV